jgi:small subunit ribosomal protein S13
MAEEQKIRQLVRISNTDLNGAQQALYALARIRGVGVMLANAGCKIAGVAPTQKIGLVSEDSIRKLESIFKNPEQHGIPAWMVNRRKDPETGKNMHLLGADLEFTQDNDIKMMKKLKCYKGIRHIQGQPVRGQRTRSHFRKNKGKVQGVKKPQIGKAGK